MTSTADELLIDEEYIANHMSDVTFSTAQQQALKVVIAGTIRNLERKLNRYFGVQTVTQDAWTTPEGRVIVDRSPLLTVVDLHRYDDLTDPPEQLSWQPVPFGRGVAVGWGLCSTLLTITYTGGTRLVTFSDSDLADVRLAVIEKCAQWMTVRHDDTVSVKDFDTRDKGSGVQSLPGLNWSDDEVKNFDRLRHRVVATGPAPSEYPGVSSLSSW